MSGYVSTLECPMCQYDSGDIDALAHSKAMHTAHDLAMKKSETPFDGFDKLDIYLLYFRRIYTHERKRTGKILAARASYKSLIENLDKEVCCYHAENQHWHHSGEFGDTEEGRKKDEAEFRNSKWPKMETQIK